MRFSLLVASPFFLWAQTARADLQVYPTRLTLGDAVRTGILTVRNRGEKAETYRVVTKYFRMRPDGNLEPVSDAGQIERPLLKEHLRFSPREFTLKPASEQVVRVLYAGPGDLPEGEYRCHLSVEPRPSDPIESGGETKKGALKAVLETKLAVAVPVFFRRGKPSSEVALENLRLVSTPDGGTAALVDMKFQGSGYPFGAFHALLSRGDDEGEEIGVLRGVAAYVSPRTVSVPLSVPKEKLSGRKLRIEFRLPETETAEKFVEAKVP